MDNTVVAEVLRDYEYALKMDKGLVDIEGCLNDDGKFDRRKFGKITCGFCEHKFNPFYLKSLRIGDWDWLWYGTEYKVPASVCGVNCPNCGEEMRFTQYIGQ